MTKKRKLRSYEATESLNVWPSFTDLMANAFMIISLFLLLALFKSLFLKYAAQETEQNLSDTERQVRLLQREIATLENELGESTSQVRKLNRASADLRQLLLSSNEQSLSRVDILESEIKRLKSAPPVVVIQDSGGYQFDSGSANLPQELKNYITLDLVDRIERISQQRNLYVVEIIGHTDGQVKLQLPNGEFAPINRNPNANRRRIEIRFSPLGKAETVR